MGTQSLTSRTDQTKPGVCYKCGSVNYGHIYIPVDI